MQLQLTVSVQMQWLQHTPNLNLILALIGKWSYLARSQQQRIIVLPVVFVIFIGVHIDLISVAESFVMVSLNGRRQLQGAFSKLGMKQRKHFSVELHLLVVLKFFGCEGNHASSLSGKQGLRIGKGNSVLNYLRRGVEAILSISSDTIRMCSDCSSNTG